MLLIFAGGCLHVDQLMPQITGAALGEWIRYALCTEIDPETFFPPKGDPGTRAKQVCAQCHGACTCRGAGMTPEQRRLRAKIAVGARWSHPMARADQTDAARSAIFTRLEREVDPAGQLSPDERALLVRAAARQLSRVR